MINAKIVRDESGGIVGFTVKNHGESKVCAAVSMLTINTVNSIEKLTEDYFRYEADEKGGHLSFMLTSPAIRTQGVNILLEALALGLESVCEAHPDELELVVEVHEESEVIT